MPAHGPTVRMQSCIVTQLVCFRLCVQGCYMRAANEGRSSTVSSSQPLREALQSTRDLIANYVSLLLVEGVVPQVCVLGWGGRRGRGEGWAVAVCRCRVRR